jgi:hypothetical protein
MYFEVVWDQSAEENISNEEGECSLMIVVLMKETVSTFETSVSMYQTTRCSNPEDSHLNIWSFALGLSKTVMLERLSDPTRWPLSVQVTEYLCSVKSYRMRRTAVRRRTSNKQSISVAARLERTAAM